MPHIYIWTLNYPVCVVNNKKNNNKYWTTFKFSKKQEAIFTLECKNVSLVNISKLQTSSRLDSPIGKYFWCKTQTYRYLLLTKCTVSKAGRRQFVHLHNNDVGSRKTKNNYFFCPWRTNSNTIQLGRIRKSLYVGVSSDRDYTPWPGAIITGANNGEWLLAVFVPSNFGRNNNVYENQPNRQWVCQPYIHTVRRREVSDSCGLRELHRAGSNFKCSWPFIQKRLWEEKKQLLICVLCLYNSIWQIEFNLQLRRIVIQIDPETWGFRQLRFAQTSQSREQF